MILVCSVFRSRRRREYDKTLLSDEHGVSVRLRREEARSPAGAAESSCWQRGRREVESVSVSWQAGTVTMAQIAPAPRKLQQTAGRRGKKQAERLGQCGACCSCPCPPSPTQTQTAKVPACHQGHTDGSLLGECGCSTDLRAKVVLFAAAHIHIHTTAQQINTYTSV